MCLHFHVYRCMRGGPRAAVAVRVQMPLPFCWRQRVISLEHCLVGQATWPFRDTPVSSTLG